jgi:glutathione synthase/RimK-type ligase-like ATP-grasp enzyme
MKKKSGIALSIGKMKKHKEMKRHYVLRKYLPEMHWHTHARTLRMLKSYSSIFIKPNHCSGGKGIIRVKKMMGNRYEVRYGNKQSYVNAESLNKMIQSYQESPHQYLVQRGLRLARYKGSIFDIRIYMQKPASKWLISGMVVRIAAPNHFVTNYSQGGQAKPLHKVLLNTFNNNKTKVNETVNRIRNVCYMITRTLDKHHPGLHQLGIDIAIDNDSRLWIIEANSKPGHQLFRKLSDKSMYRTIMKNKRLIRKQYHS